MTRYNERMQFQVPQFIEVEDKIIGPFTFKQFIYVAGGVGLAYMLWRFLPLWAAGPLMLTVVAFGGALAFFSINNRPFIVTLEAGFYYLLHPKLYLWNTGRKNTQATKSTEKKKAVESAVHIPKLSDSKLHDLAWSLDITEEIQQAQEAAQKRDATLAARTANTAVGRGAMPITAHRAAPAGSI